MSDGGYVCFKALRGRKRDAERDRKRERDLTARLLLCATEAKSIVRRFTASNSFL